MATMKVKQLLLVSGGALLGIAVLAGYGNLKGTSEITGATECLHQDEDHARKIASSFVKGKLEATDVFKIRNPCMTRITMAGANGVVGDIYVLGDGETILNGSIHRLGDTINVDPSIQLSQRESSEQSIQAEAPGQQEYGAQQQHAEPFLTAPTTQDETSVSHTAIALPGQKIEPDSNFSPTLTIPSSESADHFMDELALLESLGNPSNTGHDVYVFMDPFCPYCHEMFVETPTLEKAGINIHWLPVATGINPGSIDAAAGMLQPDNSHARWEIAKHWMDNGALPDTAESGQKGIEAVRTNTENLAAIAKHISDAGTPLILVRGKASGDIYIINGGRTPRQVLGAALN